MATLAFHCYGSHSYLEHSIRAAQFNPVYEHTINRALDDLAQENHEAYQPRFIGQITR